MDAFEREEDQLGRDLASGAISVAEYNKQLRELHRDYRDAAHEAALGAYENELSNW